MFKWFKPVKFPTSLFVIASLATLILFFIINFVLIMNKYGLTADTSGNNGEKFYLNDQYNSGDPMITKQPELKDMITGPIITDIDPSLGKKNAQVIIVEYSDYVCDFCKGQEGVIRQIIDEYPDQIKLVWKDYPEPDWESESWMAAKAARCAGDQGRYWDYHDELFLATEITQDFLLKTAKNIDLNNNAFNECMLDIKYDDVITDNIVEANALGINGVPYFYVNDKELLGEISYDELKEVVEHELSGNSE